MWDIFGKSEYKEVVEQKDEDKLSDMFDDIIGYDQVKRIILKVLRAKKAIHPLLYGHMGTNKTGFCIAMKDHKELKGKVEFITGARSSKAGISDMLFARGDKFRILIIDEIEYLPKSDQAVLLSLMTTGILKATISNKEKSKELPRLIIMATCNDPTKLLKPLFNRFLKIKMEPYEEEEFKEIVNTKLRDYEISKEMIEMIVEITLEYAGTDVREAIRCAELSPRTRQDVIDYFEVGQ